MRRNRQLRKGAGYHVSGRINRGEMIFDVKETKAMFMNTLRRAKKKFKFKITNFCIMNNHVHLMITPGRGASLSKIMQWVLSVFAMNWNRKFNLKGHVWEGRFFSRIIESFKDFLNTFGYIDENPVAAKLVKYPHQWQYSGAWYHRHRLRGIIEKPDEVIAHFFPEHLPG